MEFTITQKAYQSPIQQLVETIRKNEHSMVYPECFDTIIRHKDVISNLPGDIVECGVWRGGFSIFLAHLFPTKKIHLFDSFEGFQPTEQTTVKFPGERHTYESSANILSTKFTLDDVKSYFKIYDLNPDDPRFNFSKGYLNVTLPVEKHNIDKISVLRVDVDAYSATVDALVHLFDKVVPGGYVVFDDLCIAESALGTYDFLKEKMDYIQLRNTITDEPFILTRERGPLDNNSGYQSGCYYIKQ